MSTAFARVAVLTALIEVAEVAPLVGATISAAELSGALGLRAATVGKALAQLVSQGMAEVIGGQYRHRCESAPRAPTPQRPGRAPPPENSLQTLRDRLLNVTASREDRTTIRFLLSTLKDPLSQREAAELLTRLEKR